MQQYFAEPCSSIMNKESRSPTKFSNRHAKKIKRSSRIRQQRFAYRAIILQFLLISLNAEHTSRILFNSLKESVIQIRGGSTEVEDSYKIFGEPKLLLDERPISSSSLRQKRRQKPREKRQQKVRLLEDPVALPPEVQEEQASVLPLQGTSSMAISLLNLTKNIIGGGMLALPAGMVAGGGTGVGAAAILLVLSASLSAYTFFNIGQSCNRTNAISFKALWTKTLGAKSAWMIDALIFSMISGLLVLFLCFLGDLFASLSTLVPGLGAGKHQVVVTLVTSTLLPLCLMKDLSALKYSSMAGLLAVVYIVFFITKRALDGSYQEGGQFFLGLAPHLRSVPLNAKGFLELTLGSMVLVNCQTTSFSVHSNAVKFYNDLKDPSPARFAKVVAAAFTISMGVYLVVMMMATKTFGKNCQGLILNNYHLEDKLAQVCRFATGISLLTSFPLVFNAFRESFVSILGAFLRRKTTPLAQRRQEKANPFTARDLSPVAWNLLTTLLLGAVTFASLVLKDITTLVSLIGSIGGGLTGYVIPASMYRKLLRRDRKTLGVKRFWALQLTHLVMLIGMVMVAGGTYVTLN
mmetsp:Transcript_34934/g.44833  ORF Transcript_34934/g.44833 Transcript_34934/m.44833 type:complete len:578 (-) Transcript_34934:580-2313(-)